MLVNFVSFSYEKKISLEQWYTKELFWAYGTFLLTAHILSLYKYELIVIFFSE